MSAGTAVSRRKIKPFQPAPVPGNLALLRPAATKTEGLPGSIRVNNGKKKGN